MANVLEVDCTAAGPLIEKDFGSNHSEVWISVDVALNASALANLLTNPSSFTDFDLIQASSHTFAGNCGAEWYVDTGPIIKWSSYNSPGADPASTPFAPTPALASMQFYTVKIHVIAGNPITQEVWIDGGSIGTVTVTSTNIADIRFLDLFQPGLAIAGGFIYFDNVTVGTSDGASDIFADDFESGNTSAWTSVDPEWSVVTDPGITPAGGGPTPASPGRVLIAFDDGPLEPSPTFTAIDQAGAFPDQFVSGYDTSNGRQTLISQTDTGTATVYINDHDLGLFDPRNSSSPYFGKLDGRQILLQLYNPVTAIWEEEWRGWIDEASYDIDGSAVNPAGEPINASIQLNCVDVLDFLNGFGLTPGLAGDMPPAGYEDGVYYSEGHVDDRIIEIHANVGIDSTRYHATSGNVNVRAVKYDPDESALTAIRDAVDAEFPFIGCFFVDRHGKSTFRGRYSRFAPDSVAAEPGSDWDFTRWGLGDGPAIVSDPTRAQMRVLSYVRSRSDIINVAIAYPQGITAPDFQPFAIYADPTSITAYGHHMAPPMSDLLTADDALQSGNPDAKTECLDFAKLLVLNKKDPLEAISSLQVKTVHPDDARATATWAFLTQSDISHIVNVAVGYPSGTGFTGASPDDDYYIEGRSLVVRPLEPGFDYVELNCEVSPAVWSMDTHGVFPPFS